MGQLQWLQIQTRPELSFDVNKCAQRSSAPTLADAKQISAVARRARDNSKAHLRYPRGVVDLSSCQLLAYGDAAFANMEGEKSQYGSIIFTTHRPQEFWRGSFQYGALLYWTSATIKRVVRSTLAAEAYAISETVETAEWLRHVLTELWPGSSLKLPRSLSLVEAQSLQRPTMVLTDSLNLAENVKSDKSGTQDKRLRIVVSMLRQAFD